MKLFLGESGKSYRIIRVAGREKLQKQLMNLGFVPDATIQLVNEVDGNFIVVVKETRLGISRELAQKIDVVPTEISDAQPIMPTIPCAGKES